MLSELEYHHSRHVNVVITVKLLNISFYTVLNMTVNRERLQLTDAVESLWQDVRDNGYAFDKLRFIAAPRSDDGISRKEDLFVKCALFDFLTEPS